MPNIKELEELVAELKEEVESYNALAASKDLEVERLRKELSNVPNLHHHTIRRPGTGDYWCIECKAWFQWPVGVP